MNRLIARQMIVFPGLARRFYWLLVLWVGTMIALPIAKFLFGPPAVVWGVVGGVLAQFAVVAALLQQTWGARRTTLSILAVMLITWAVEALGTATGWPFGRYHYTDLLQPQLGHVPLLIPLAWMMMLPAAWAVAAAISGAWRGPKFVILSGLALTAWDLFLDPQMVAWGLWVWDQPGGYFGIPWRNFLGWFGTAALITILVRPPRLPVRPLLLIYAIVWLLETGGLLFFWGLPGPGLVGFLAMGSLWSLAWLRREE